MVELGLRDVGYTYFNIDDCWAIGRDNRTNALIPDPAIFPYGVKTVADYVHARGLKFGMYADRGDFT